MKYNFDEVIDRKGTNSVKWSYLKQLYGDEDVLPMWVADMDFKSPKEVINAMKKRVEHGVFGYTVKSNSFYSSIINWVKKRHNWKINKEWIVCTPGVVKGLNLATITFTKKGDKIVLQSPIYPPFTSTIKNNERIVLNNSLKFDGNKYVMDLDDLQNKIDSKTKMLFLCNPHNPVGRVWTYDELKKLGEICLKNNILIISDEIHSDLIYTGYKHVPIASISKELANNTITLIAPSKTFNIAGLCMSVAIIPNEKIREQYKNTANIIGLDSGNIFSMVGLETAYTYGEEWLEQLLKYLEDNLNFVVNYIKNNIPKVNISKPQGTYLVWLDFRELGLNDKELKELIVRKAKVGLNDGPTFGVGGSGFQRMNIGCPRSVLKEGLSRIEKAVKSL